MPDKDFDEAVQSATEEATTSRHELGFAYAAEFSKDPDKFDPRKLMMLGGVGLSSFVAAVGVPTVAVSQPNVEPPNAAAASDEPPRNWERQRAVLIPFELYGLLVGSLTGIGIVIGCALVL